MSIQELQKEMLSLKTSERVQLLELLWESLDKTDPEIEQIWVKESESRYKAYKDGNVVPIPLEDLKKKMDQ